MSPPRYRYVLPPRNSLELVQSTLLRVQLLMPWLGLGTMDQDIYQFQDSNQG